MCYGDHGGTQDKETVPISSKALPRRACFSSLNGLVGKKYPIYPCIAMFMGAPLDMDKGEIGYWICQTLVGQRIPGVRSVKLMIMRRRTITVFVYIYNLR